MYPSHETPEPQEQLDPSLAPENATPSNAIELPQLQLPQGGGALRGIDAQFMANATNGTAGLSIPLPLTPGRRAFTPALSLHYNSGNGNSAFGLGWNLSLGSIQQLTRQHIPRYNTPLRESVFLALGGAEVVPQLRPNSTDLWQDQADTLTITRFRPRVEGDFARIEHIQHPTQGTYWRVTTANNTVTFYGYSKAARIADPNNEKHIFEWRPEFSYDQHGNWMHYHYKAEDLANIPKVVHEQHRLQGLASFTNQYLKRVRYANTTPYYPDPQQPYTLQLPDTTDHHFELVLDYGDHHPEQPTPNPDRPWAARPDAFSRHQAGFEIRTQRRCQRALLFHHFPDEQQFADTPQAEAFGEGYLVRSLDLSYQAASEGDFCEVSYLHQVVERGYIRRPDGTYSHQALPPVELDYQPLDWQRAVQTVQTPQGQAPQVQLDQQWTDWYNNGLPGLLTERQEGWYYQPNLGTNAEGALTLGTAQALLTKPSFLGLNDGTLSIRDLQSNGSKQIVVDSEGLHGYFEWDGDQTWQQFQAFEQVPRHPRFDPHTRRLDLTGNGQPDLVITEEQAFVWYASAGKKGYEAPERTPKPWEEAKGPAIVFADSEEAIFLADMTGDGLTDIVRIRHHSICYWPNQGYGRFGAKVTMSQAPLLDQPDLFNPKQLHLADISGTGAADLVYVGRKGVTAYLNYSGNAWGEGLLLAPPLPTGVGTRFEVRDLLGTGTACLVWTSTLPGQAQRPIRYVDLLNGKKPHLLTQYRNNCGSTTTLAYEPSTQAYLRDQAAGRPWVTQLPFPVQLLRQVVIEEALSQRRFTTDYSYHYGYYDPTERLFRGFGLVEQQDTETHEVWQTNNQGNALTKDSALYQPPVLTRSWYHTGYYEAKEAVLKRYAKDTWSAVYQTAFPQEGLALQEQAFLETTWAMQGERLSANEWREAHAACRGQLLRQEVFALDATADDPASQQRAKVPYTVQLYRYQVQRLQAASDTFASFLVSEQETQTLHYERLPDDPRRSQVLNLDIDELGNVLEQVSVVYGRVATAAQEQANALRTQVSDFAEEVLAGNAQEQAQLQTAFDDYVGRTQAAQTQQHLLYTQNQYAQHQNQPDVDLPHAYRLRVPAGSSTYELTGWQASGDWFTAAELAQPLAQSQPLAYRDQPSVGQQHRLVEQIEHEYWSDALQPLPVGEYDTLGLPYQNYQLAYTPALVEALYSNLQANGIPAATLLTNEGQYSPRDGNWWIRSGIQHYRQHNGEALAAVQGRFYQPVRYEDAQGLVTSVLYDAYFLLPRQVDDPIGNRSQALVLDYRLMQPTRLLDHNANPSRVLLDELGRVKAMAVEGNGIYADANRNSVQLLDAADTLQGLLPYWTPQEEALWDKLRQAATTSSTDQAALEQATRQLLQGASQYFCYDTQAFAQYGSPCHSVSLQRTQHSAAGNTALLQMSWTYTDGLGQALLTKTGAEPGIARFVDEQGQVQSKDTGTAWRWVGSGRTIYNNKNKPVQQYEPYFSTHFGYESLPELVQVGVTTTLYHDALGRVVRSLLPDATLTRVQYHPWAVQHWDPTDTVLESTWYRDRAQGRIDAALQVEGKDPVAEQAAALQSAAHAETPARQYLDSLGRPVLHLEDLGQDAQQRQRWVATFVVLDVEGNALAVLDARRHTAAQYQYNLLGQRLVRHLNASGTRWLLQDAVGKPRYLWDQRGHVLVHQYDAFQRLSALQVLGGDGDQPLAHHYERLYYGESQPDAEQHNLRGQLVRHLDTAGELRMERFDFKGNLLRLTRQFLTDYQNTPHWAEAPAAQAALLDANLGSFWVETQYDALNRPVQIDRVDGSRTLPQYNVRGLEAGLRLEQTNAPAQEVVKRLTYDAKGQRLQLQLGDSAGHVLATTQYTYDRETFRLQRLRTVRQGEPLQDLEYTYNAIGNVAQLRDRAIPTEYYNNQRIEAVATYQYDALQRLVAATGREHAGQAVHFGPCDRTRDTAFFQSYEVGNALAWRNYQQTYRYDSLGNLLEQRHQAPNGNWTRQYHYEAATNRLAETRVGGQTYQYTHHVQHGFMTALPQLSLMRWDFQDQLQATAQTVACTHDAQVATTYYVYNSQGQRVRKVNTTTNATKKDERLYVGDLDIYRSYHGDSTGLVRYSLQLQLAGQRLVQVDTRNAVDDGTAVRTLRFQLTNLTQSVSLELDDQGRLISYEEYHPYGTTAYQARDKTIKAAAKRYRYSSMERDEETGLSYHAARYYLPWLGRWLSSDPAGLAAGMNTYAYVRGNPVNRVDPSGLEDEPTTIPNLEPPPPLPSFEFPPLSGKLRLLDGNLQLRLEESTDSTLRFDSNLQDPQGDTRANIVGSRSLHLDLFPKDWYGLSLGFVRTTGTFFGSTGLGTMIGNNDRYLTDSTTYSGVFGLGPSVVTPLRFSIFDQNVTIQDNTSNAITFIYGQSTYRHGLLSGYNPLDSYDQRVANLGLRVAWGTGFINSFLFSTYNDTDAVTGPGTDHLWTAGATLGLGFSNGMAWYLSYMSFTGEFAGRDQRYACPNSSDGCYIQTDAQMMMNRNEWTLRTEFDNYFLSTTFLLDRRFNGQHHVHDSPLAKSAAEFRYPHEVMMHYGFLINFGGIIPLPF